MTTKTMYFDSINTYTLSADCGQWSLKEDIPKKNTFIRIRAGKGKHWFELLPPNNRPFVFSKKYSRPSDCMAAARSFAKTFDMVIKR